MTSISNNTPQRRRSSIELPAEITDLHSQLLQQIGTVHNTTATLLHTQENELIEFFQNYTKRLNDSYNNSNTSTQLTNNELVLKYTHLNELLNQLHTRYGALQQEQVNTLEQLNTVKCELDLVNSDKINILKDNVRLKHCNEHYKQLLQQHNIDCTLPIETVTSGNIVNKKTLYNRPGTATRIHTTTTYDDSIHRPATANPTHTRPHSSQSDNEVIKYKQLLTDSNKHIDKLHKQVTALNERIQQDKADKLQLAHLMKQTAQQYNDINKENNHRNTTQLNTMSLEQRQYILSQLSINKQFWLYMQYIVDSSNIRNKWSQGSRPVTAAYKSSTDTQH